MCGIHLSLCRLVTEHCHEQASFSSSESPQHHVHSAEGSSSGSGNGDCCCCSFPVEWLIRRGPDHHGSHQIQQEWHHPDDYGSTTTVTTVKCSLQASVLSMRERLVRQPVRLLVPQRIIENTTSDTRHHHHHHNHDSSDNEENDAYYLCWNGEVYQEQQIRTAAAEGGQGDHHDVWRFQESDTELVTQRLQEALEQTNQEPVSDYDHHVRNEESSRQQQDDHDGIFQAIVKVMSSLINAEFAFCLKTPRAMYYGKDGWGCRSLLTGKCPCSCINAETNTSVAHSFDAKAAGETKAPYRVERSCWYLSSVSEATVNCSKCNNSTEWTEVSPGLVFEYNLVTGQTRSLPLKAPQINGTLTESIMATMKAPSHAVQLRGSNSKGSDDDDIHIESRRLSQDDDDDDAHQDAIPDENLEPSRQLYALLRQAVRRRLTGPSTILFSGGLDSVVLAALALQQQQELQQDERNGRDYSIFLVNISFVDNDDDSGTLPSNQEQAVPVAADTRAALASYQELQRLFPNSDFEFVRRQVTYKQVAEQEERIRKLIYPKHTTMDLNITTALWFAAESSSPKHRILLTGLGADELMGGYGRHRKAWQRGGAFALREELQLDQERLWERNLGRDDRVLSDHGKEARFPYLDRDVVQYLQSLAAASMPSLSSICDLTLPPGQGDKRILRLVASHFLHLESASTAVKRAIQFGSRISHVCDKRRFGSRRKAKGESLAVKV